MNQAQPTNLVERLAARWFPGYRKDDKQPSKEARWWINNIADEIGESRHRTATQVYDWLKSEAGQDDS